MATDRKADHVGNHGGAYTDNDGMSRQFTYIDHDKKTKIGRYTETEDEAEKRRAEYKAYVEETIEHILAMPPVYFLQSGNTFANQYVMAGEKGIRWDEPVVRDALTINTDMRGLVYQIVCRYQTPEANEKLRNMSYEDYIAGKWREITD